MHKFLISFIVFFALSTVAIGQVCTGSLGDPIVNYTFGSGRNPGAPLAPGVTNYNYVANTCPGDGFYTIGNSTSGCNGNSWHTVTEDHTPNDVAGFMMIINAAASAGVFYVDTIPGLCEGTTFEFASWILNVGKGGFCGGSPINPQITFSIETTSGVVLKTYSTGNIAFYPTPTWVQYGTFFTTPVGVSTVVVRMTNNAPGGCGNDLLLDDITFRPCGPLVTANIGGTNSVTICSSNVTPTLLSATISTGYVNPYYQWQVSNDNGVTWNNIPGANSLNFTIPAIYIPGTYLFRLTVSEAANSSNIACRTVSNSVTLHIDPSPPVPSFTASAPDCINKTVTFTDQPTSPAGSITSWIWNFGDGPPIVTASTNANQVHTYTAAGSYTVTLQVQGSGGCLSPVFSMAVVIPSSPAFGFTYNDTCTNQPIQFATTAGGTYSWDFGDVSTPSTLQNPIKSYTTAGTYNVTLQVTFPGGCVGSVMHQVVIGNLPVLPSFTIAPAAACINQVVTFTDQPTNPAGSVTEWIWNFGDASGITSTADTAQSHSYATTGTYTVTLQVKGVGGCLSAVFSKTITISPIPVLPSFTSNPTSACINVPISFTDVATNPVGSITQWSWNFGDASAIVNATTNVVQTHSYSAAGTYNVTLQVTGLGGCVSALFTKQIIITAASPVDFTFVTGCVNAATTFAVTPPGPAGTIYNWTFGDGNTSTQINPSNNYASSGTFNATLAVIFVGGCSGNNAHNVIIAPAPATPSFSSVPTAACLNQQVVFNGQSTDPAASITEWIWNFGDATPIVTAATNVAQPHTYATSGTFTVSLQVKGTGGCLSTIFSKTISISPIPVLPSFTINPTVACINVPVTFTDVATNPVGSITQWSWNFGDAAAIVNATTNVVQTHSYAAAGTYNVTLQLTGTGGCLSPVFMKQVTITSAPAIDFTYTIGCAKAATTFAVTPPGPAGAQYSWTFGDGNISAQANPSNTYNSSGTYNVTLGVNFPGGCIGNAAHQVTITPSPATPSFTSVPMAACINQQVIFNGQSTDPAGSITEWTWNFGDATPIVTAATNVAQPHTYATAGTYTVTLQVKGVGGCLSSVFQNTIIISPIPVIPSFNAVATACINVPVTFTDVPANPAGSIIQWKWNFGDGSPLVTATTNAVQTHTYTTAGTYNVTLQLTGVGGCLSPIFTKPITISNPPVAAFTFTVGCVNAATTFNVTNPGPTGTQYNWSFGDGGTSTQINPSHIYTTGGTNNVTLIMTLPGGCNGSISHSVIINPLPALPAFTSPAKACVNAPVTFINQTPNTAGNIAQWIWNFGDATAVVTTTTAANQIHTYATAGTFTISLQVKNTLGCVSPLFTQTIIIGAIPTVDFTFTTTCVKDPIQFTGITNAGVGAIFLWTFGDNTTSGLQSPPKTYATGATYNVKLQVTTALGCTANITHPVTVTPAPPTPVFTAPSAVCINKPVTFVPQSTIPPGVVKWTWNFGDGSAVVVAAGNVSQTHIYTAAGNYNVTLQLTGAGGCAGNIYSLPINVSVNPTVDFTFNNSCENTPVNFLAVTNGSVVQWKFGDGGMTNVPGPVHTYTTGGNYDAVLIVKSAAGCTDSIKKTVAITAKPVVNFQVTGTDTICSNQVLSVINTTTATGPISYTKIYWNWLDNTDTTGDNVSVTGKVYTHTYPSFHTPLVKRAIIRMTANTGASCQAEHFDTVYLKAIPALTFSMVKQSCEGDTVFQINTVKETSGMAGQFYFTGTGVSLQGMFDPVVSGPGTHVVIYHYQGTNGCNDTIQGLVPVLKKPGISAGSDKAVRVGEKVQLTATSDYIYTYTWSPANTLSSSAILRPVAEPVVQTVYTLLAVSSQGCRASDSVTVLILKDPVIPNVFSPNSDGVNDRWELKNLSMYTGCTVEIFNRYGRRVYNSIGYSKPWDGMYNDGPSPVGVYYYIIKLQPDLRPLTGWVTLLR